MSYLLWRSYETSYFLSFILQENHLLSLSVGFSFGKITQKQIDKNIAYIKKILDNNFETYMLGRWKRTFPFS